MSINLSTESEPARYQQLREQEIVESSSHSSGTSSRNKDMQESNGPNRNGGGDGSRYNSNEESERVMLHGIDVEEQELEPFTWEDGLVMIRDYFKMDWRDLPILTWGPTLTKQMALRDLLAGVSVATLLIPQALACKIIHLIVVWVSFSQQ